MLMDSKQEHAILRHFDASKPEIILQRDLLQRHDSKFLIGEKISGVDFMLGHSLYMADKLRCVNEDMVSIHGYIELINSLETFQKAINT